ncbi:uncharacterized protein LOC122805580 [Protopterus annectens]|uniref:uncharacterized protein LOC122805580 n=1 Tax=Protopterus annectens TaxID=7888 RepID=UPI001CFB6D76|nr:uncharacterized protein LOC122805580 [Protopterus annectens]
MSRSHHWALWSVIIVALYFGGGGVSSTAMEQDLCSDKEQPLFSAEPRELPAMSECTVNCAIQTYQRIWLSQKHLTVRLNEASRGEEREYCWQMQVQCKRGEKLQKAFIYLNPSSAAYGAATQFELYGTFFSKHKRFKPTQVDSDMGMDCGIQFDVTKPIRQMGNTYNFCVKVACQGESMCDTSDLVLKCPPFLVTKWNSSAKTVV